MSELPEGIFSALRLYRDKDHDGLVDGFDYVETLKYAQALESETKVLREALSDLVTGCEFLNVPVSDEIKALSTQ